MSSIIPYTFPETESPVRVVAIDGEPWFVAADVTAVLGYSNGRMAVANLPERMKSSVTIADGTPGNPNRSVISESGVYRLVMRSTMPEAERFQDWIAEDVIPSIRRTGSYSVAPVAPSLPDLTTPQGVLALAQQFARTAEQLVEADAKLRELEPKALAHDTLMAAQDGDVLIREAAKSLGWQEKQLRGFLLDEHLIYRRQATCGVTQYDFYAANAAHFNAVLRTVEHTWGSRAHYTLHVTPQGMGLIQKRIAKRQAEMRDAIGGAA
ncbi:BRO family protein [Kitasatospora cineracea]|uniref:Phage antirepressor protein KilAC domain-containing protein n=1 Tax=Kitasatospora cineracea TaxID=88074 RepID=A0A3N4RW25_9ACTN|nr:BRO family protein [Kitasatospora cineracea]RPE34975.1 phage antirepressor protein KilAC domain-containing protein [Kitasatospora cineracea]